jgi:hypothetical protein
MAMLMIGELARRTGVKVNTIRFYEDIALMPKAARTDSGRRTYSEADVKRLTFHTKRTGSGFFNGGAEVTDCSLGASGPRLRSGGWDRTPPSPGCRSEDVSPDADAVGAGTGGR